MIVLIKPQFEAGRTEVRRPSCKMLLLLLLPVPIFAHFRWACVIAGVERGRCEGCAGAYAGD